MQFKTFFDELDEKTSNKIYLNEAKERDALKGQNCLIIGTLQPVQIASLATYRQPLSFSLLISSIYKPGGSAPGLRTALELQLLGAERVLVVEQRENYLTNHFVHLWSYVVNDLKSLGGRLFFGLDSLLDHIPLKKLELSLLKIALIFGCEFVYGVQFEEICPMCLSRLALSDECFCNLHLNDSANRTGAFAHFKVSASDGMITSRLNSFAFNILIDAGERSSFFNKFFAKKELKGKQTIVIRCSFLNSKDQKGLIIPASSLSYVDCKDHPHLFNILTEITGADLENYCMYLDEAISFVFTPKKQSLLAKGVLIEDKSSDKELFHPANINKAELQNYAKSCCKFLTGLVEVKFATNPANGEPDCSINDFTMMFASENACCVKDIVLRSKCCRKSEFKKDQLLISLVGASLQASSWSLLGSRIGRGFFSAMDCAWLCRQYGLKVLSSRVPKEQIESNALEVIAERETVYKLLAQTTSESISPSFQLYTIDPSTRYLSLKLPPTPNPDDYKHLLHAKMLS